MNNQLTVCLVGSSGAIGHHLLNFLNQKEQIQQIITLTRKSNENIFSKEKNIIIDFDQLASLKIKADIFICCLGTTMKLAGSQKNFKKVDFDYVVSFAKLAESASAQKFLVISSVGASQNSKVFYNRIKGEMEMAIQKLNIPCIEIFQPSLLLGERSQNRPSEKFAKILAPLLNPFLFGSMKKYLAIKSEDVAKALVKRSLANEKGLKIFSSDQIKTLSLF